MPSGTLVQSNEKSSKSKQTIATMERIIIKKKIIFTTTSLHHTTLVLICIRFTCPRCYSEGQEDRLAGGQRQIRVRKKKKKESSYRRLY